MIQTRMILVNVFWGTAILQKSYDSSYSYHENSLLTGAESRMARKH